jgi:hypothetical protein
MIFVVEFSPSAIQAGNQNEPKTEGEADLQLTAKNLSMSDYRLAHKLRVAASTAKESRLILTLAAPYLVSILIKFKII